MATGIKRLPGMMVSLFLVLPLLATGCGKAAAPTSPTPTQNETQVYTAISAPSLPISVTLSISDSPMLNRPVEMTATFTLGGKGTALQIAENTNVRIILPEGIELISSSAKLERQGDNVTARTLPQGSRELFSSNTSIGKLEWQGDMVYGTKYQVLSTIKAVKTGDWQIETSAFYIPG